MSRGDTESPKIAKGNAMVDLAAKAAVMQMSMPQIINRLSFSKTELRPIHTRKQQQASLPEKEKMAGSWL